MDDSRAGQTMTAKGGAATSASKASAGAGQVASDAASAKQAPTGVVGQPKDKASSLVGQVKDQALSAATDQKEGLADRIDEVARSLHKSGEQFAGQQDWIAGAIERGAAELGSLATSLRENDLGDIVAQVKSFARRQPALFAGASLAAGFAIARLGRIVAADVSRDDLPTMPEVGHGGR